MHARYMTMVRTQVSNNQPAIFEPAVAAQIAAYFYRSNKQKESKPDYEPWEWIDDFGALFDSVLLHEVRWP